MTRSNVVTAPAPAPAPLARTRSCVPLQMAVEEAREKGSVLDRVARLEHRLAQVQIDSSLRIIKQTEHVNLFLIVFILTKISSMFGEHLDIVRI